MSSQSEIDIPGDIGFHPGQDSKVPLVVLDKDEARAVFARAVAEHMDGMSADEFLRRLDSGEWDEVIDDDGYQHVMMLALMSDFGR